MSRRRCLFTSRCWRVRESVKKRLRRRELSGDGSVAKDWIAFADANANDLAVQTAILKVANSTHADRQFIARTIDRVKALTGPEGQTWKIERARWLITGENKDKDSAE